MTFSDIRVLWEREVRKFVSGPTRIVSLFLTPILWLALFGVGIRRGLNVSVQGYDYVQFILPGVIGMNLLTASARGGSSILRDKEWGFLKEVLVAPVSRVNILLGFGFGVVTRSAVQALLLLLVGTVLGIHLGAGLELLLALGQTFLFVFLLGLALVSLTVALAWRLDDLPTYGAVSGAVTFPLTLLSGSLFPIKNLPDWLAIPMKLNPMTYGIDALRQSLLGSAAGAFELWLDAGVLAVFLVLALGMAVMVMRRTE